jgi:hypothetical protein
MAKTVDLELPLQSATMQRFSFFSQFYLGLLAVKSLLVNVS